MIEPRHIENGDASVVLTERGKEGSGYALEDDEQEVARPRLTAEARGTLEVPDCETTVSDRVRAIRRGLDLEQAGGLGAEKIGLAPTRDGPGLRDDSDRGDDRTSECQRIVWLPGQAGARSTPRQNHRNDCREDQNERVGRCKDRTSEERRVDQIAGMGKIGHRAQFVDVIVIGEVREAPESDAQSPRTTEPGSEPRARDQTRCEDE